MEYDNILEKLNEIAKQSKEGIKNIVVQEALEYSDPISFFKDLSQYGCISGMVGSLVYYYDTHEFYQKHYNEIEELRTDYEVNTGTSLQPKGDLMNWYAWFSFEITAQQLAVDLGIIKI